LLYIILIKDGFLNYYSFEKYRFLLENCICKLVMLPCMLITLNEKGDHSYALNEHIAFSRVSNNQVESLLFLSSRPNLSIIWSTLNE